MGFLTPHFEKIYAGARIITGLVFMLHGMQKVLGFFGGAPEGAPAFVVWGAGSIELIGGALIAIGLFAAPAAFVASGTMAVAFFLVHAPRGILPLQEAGNGGELAVLYCWVFLVIAARGSGIWSIDDLRGGRADASE